MNKHTVLTFLLATISMGCFGQRLKQNWWYDYEGKLGVANIQLSIYSVGDGYVKGNYCYKKYETKIPLEGQIIENRVELKEVSKGKTNDHFKGSIDSLDNFTGTWTDSSGIKAISFTLHLQSSCYSDSFRHRYSYLAEPDNIVEEFMKRVKSAVKKSDKVWIASNTYFPITVLVNAKKITLKNKEQLINNFENLFNQPFKDKINLACACNLFTNAQGVMLGNGEIWINDVLTSNNKPRLYIKAINN